VHEGVSKSQVARDTGYTREYVTDLVKKAEAEGVGTAQGATN
jgi:CRP-like cAMP-binding protein